MSLRSILNMATYTFLLFGVLLFTLSTICVSTTPFTETTLNDGFSLELIPRNSPKSPFYKPTHTPSQRMADAIERSFNRINRFYPQTNKVYSKDDVPRPEIVSDQGEYLMRYAIGTPPFEIMGTFDTGSDLIWSQCKPCKFCYNQTTPDFDPSKSTTYKPVSCSSDFCQSLGESSCYTGGDVACQYDMSYGDGSFSSGELAFETLTLGSTTGQTISFPKFPIGCGHHNGGTFPPEASGIVGLGGGLVSLTSQMGPSIGSKFSYCLIPFFSPKTTIKLNFGQNAVVAGSGTVSTPLVSGPVKTFYYLTLQGISVGPKRVDFVSKSTSAVEDGNIIIDSGTTLTLLPQDFYARLESEVAAQIKLVRVRNEMLNLCYKAAPNTIKAPIITAHFRGADVVLNAVNTFVSVSDDVVCFAFAPAKIGGAIFGNLAQVNLLVGYDLQKKAVSFKPTDCSKL